MTTGKPKRRSALVAGLLSFVQPGLGQLYCGRWRAAGLFYSGLLVLWVLASSSAHWALSPGWLLVGWLGSDLLLTLAAVVEAVLGARRMGEYKPVWYTRWYICLAAGFVVNLGLAVFMQTPADRLSAFHIPSAAMAPTMLVGDYVYAQGPSTAGPLIRPCDIVVFRKPGPVGGAETISAKRVVAMPGDRVGYVGGRLRLNGKFVAREQVGTDGDATIFRETLPSGCSYLIQEWDDYGPLDNTGESTVPPDSFYALGDNRDDSLDSRMRSIGPIPFDNYRGRVLLIYWSKDWRRIGTILS
jgi:signal peptidase I